MIKDVVIPMAGKGTRMFNLTKITNKATLAFGEKTIIEHIIDSFDENITDLYLIINANDNLIPLLGYRYHNINIHYILQEKNLGLADAILKLKGIINKIFLLVLCDVIFDKTTIKKMIDYGNNNESVVLLKECNKNIEEYGIALIDNNGFVNEIIGLNRCNHPSNNIIIGGYVLANNIFDEIGKLTIDSTGELNFNEALNNLAKIKKLKYLFDNNEYYDVGTMDRYIDSLKRYLR